MPTARPRLILKRHVHPPQGRTSMKRALIIAAGCALLAGPASAQSPPPGPDRDGDRVDSRDMRDIRGDRDRRGDWSRGDWDDGPRGRGGDWHGAGVITADTNMVQAFCSRAEIHASRCDVTRTSPCEPA